MNKKVFENIISLFTIKGADYILGIITFPYLLKTLGPANYGYITFGQSIINYFVIICDFGFYLTASKSIAQSTKNEQGKIFTSIMASKCIIFLIISVFFFLLLKNISYLENNKNLYLSLYLLVIGNVIFPVWFFQGIQRMRYITLVNILSKIITTAIIFLYINTSSDYIIAAIVQSSVNVIAGIFSWIIILRKYNYLLVKIDLLDIYIHLKEAWQIFISNLAINLYTASNIFILGLFTNDTVVGYFGGAKKIIDCLGGVLITLSQAIYPYINNTIMKSKENTIIFIKKCMWIICSSVLFISISINIFAKYIVVLILGEGYTEAVLILKIIAFIPFITSLSNIWGIQTLIPFGYKKEFSNIVIKSSVLNICIIIPFVYYYQAVGIACSMLITESFVSIMCFLALKKYKINLF